jgi:WD40 repeat protein
VRWHECDDKLAVCADRHGMVLCANTGRALYNLAGHTATVRAIAFCEENSCLLATGSRDGVVNLWDTRTYHRKGLFGERFAF